MKTARPARPAERKRWRLWHFAVIVLAAALVLGAIRAIARGPGGPAVNSLVALVMAAACGGASYGIVQAGRKVAGRATTGLKQWGIHRDGVIGFLAYLVGLGLEVGFVLAAIVIGPIATIALLFWLARLAGH